MKEQEKKIVNLNNRFDGLESQMTSFKDDVNMKLDDIFTKLKPRMTRGQEMVIGTLLIGWLVGIMLYTTDTRSNTRNNETRIELMEGISKDISKIKEDVAYIKGGFDANKNINN